MRILQAVKRLKHGGAEKVVLALVEAAQSEGHEVAVAAAEGEWSARFSCRRYEIPPSGMSPGALLGGAWALRAAIRDFKPDIVHAHNPGIIAMTSVATLRGRTVPALGTSHGGTSRTTLAKHAMLFRLAGLPIISCGPGVTVVLEEAGLKVIRTIDNGVASAVPGKDPGAVRRALGIHPDRPIAAVVGRLTPAKNQAQVLRAVSKLPYLDLLVCGDGEDRPELEQLAHTLDIVERVHFLGMRTDAREIMGAADVVVLTSKYEGLPLTMIEAMSEGTPVIASDVIGSHELIQNEQNGLLVPLGDPTALALAISRIFNETSLVRRLQENGIRTAQNYSYEQMVSRHLHLYEEFVSPSWR